MLINKLKGGSCMKRNSKRLIMIGIPVIVIYFILINLYVSNLLLSIGLLVSSLFVLFLYVSALSKSTKNKNSSTLFLIISEIALFVLVFSLR